ncbi:hypothetical protein QFZ81_001669 [Paenibacillus sp. V4I9]|nr:hypothetical protein [Paenibacillus sp. V4I9]
MFVKLCSFFSRYPPQPLFHTSQRLRDLIENDVLMHLRSLKKTRKDVSLHDPIGTDKEGMSGNGYKR